MIHHVFGAIDYWAMGPCHGRKYIYFVAKIDEVWVLRYRDLNHLEDRSIYCRDHQHVIEHLKILEGQH